VATFQDFELDPTTVEKIANRLVDAVVERVIEAIRADVISPKATAMTHWLDAREVAQRLGVSREWVYEHANELSVSRIGSGPRPRLRFPPQVLDSRVRGLVAPKTRDEVGERRPQPRGLIPIRGS
jgi:predicted DNA-binding transcriptional regulator AlpA